jgi:hypothetical protein
MEPAAHMYPSDLEKFQSAETFATAYSVAVGNPDERSVPLYTLSDVEELKQMVVWAYSKLHHASYSKQDDALMLDRMKLLLEFGV